MDASIDMSTTKVRDGPRLKNGLTAAGFSI